MNLKPYFQTIYIFGDKENLEKLKCFISQINSNNYSRVYEREEKNIITIFSKEDGVKYNISFKDSYISIYSIFAADGFFNKYKEFTGELYNNLLVKFFDTLLKNYIIDELKAALTCEITDPNFDLLYIDPENYTTYRR